MLIDKGVSVGEVITIKLTSGEELIGKVEELGPLHYKLSRPMVLSMTSKGIGMVPYLFTVDPEKSVKISSATVVVAEATLKEFADAYTEQTTGIKLA